MEENALMEVREDGQLLVMMDGTRWRVAVGEHTKSLLWLPTEAVNVEDAGGGSYVIRRQSDGESVTAWPE